MKIRDASNVLREVAAIHIRDASNVSRLVKRMHIRTAANVSREVAGTGTAGTAMVVTATPATVSGAQTSHGFREILTNTTTATVSGGAAPYTYLWSVDEPGWSISHPTAATTDFLSPPLGGGEGSATGATCTVTDKNGNPATSNTVTASAYNDGI